MSEAVHIKFWGVRGSTPCANAENMEFGGNTTCIQIDAAAMEDLLIVDCGTGLRNLGNQLIGENKPVRGNIFITHPHWDHLQGFPFFKPFYRNDSWFRIYMPPQDNVGCTEILQGHMSNTFFPVTIDMLQADMDCETFREEVMNFAGYSVDFMWAEHTVPTAIYRFKIGNKTIIFAPDNEIPLELTTEQEKTFVSDFIQFISSADLLIHDGQFSEDQHKERKGWGHSSWNRVVELALRAGVPRLILTHHDPDSSDTYLTDLNKKLIRDYGDQFREIFFAKEGQTISI